MYTTLHKNNTKFTVEITFFIMYFHPFTKNKSKVAGLHPTTKSNLRTALGVEICKLCIIARIWKPLSGKFSDLCREMGICSDVM